MAGKVARDLDHASDSCCLRERDLIAHIHLVRRNVHLAAIHFHVAVANKLPRLTARTRIAHAESNVIQTTLQLLQKHSPVTPGCAMPSRSRRGTGLRG